MRTNLSSQWLSWAAIPSWHLLLLRFPVNVRKSTAPWVFFLIFWSIFYLFIVVQSLSHVHLLLWFPAIALQIPMSMGFPRQEYWSRFPLPSPWDLPDTGIKPIVLILLNSKVIQIYIYIYNHIYIIFMYILFQILFPLCFIIGYWM